MFKSVTYRLSSKRQIFVPKYVIECPYYGKKLIVIKKNTRLNPQKDKNGYPSPLSQTYFRFLRLMIFALSGKRSQESKTSVFM